MADVTWHETDELRIISGTAGPMRGAGTLENGQIPAFLQVPEMADVFEVIAAKTIAAKSATRGAPPPVISADISVDDGAHYMMFVRHPSGALTYTTGAAKTVDGDDIGAQTQRPKNYVIEFKTPMALSAYPHVRRGIVDDLVDAVVDGVIVRVKDFVAEWAVNKAEELIWKRRGRDPGLYQITPKVNALELKKIGKRGVKVGPSGRALLLLHGTFSTTQGSFNGLANADFFAQIADTYGDAIYGFEHFTVSVSAQDNANDLLAALPDDGVEFDVITQSRGGLVLRNLVERSSSLKNGHRFRLGRAALVACPNEGTPLATPENWNRTIGWIANVLDMFPPNPILTHAAMLGDWLVWFAHAGVKASEGLEAMNMNGDTVRRLQLPPGPPTGRYSTLCSNFEPDGSVLARAADLGFDLFFDMPNDLVVPTEGAYRIDHLLAHVPADQIGVYGRGGNIDNEGKEVHHLNSFGRAKTQEFLLNALRGTAQELPAFDPAQRLPFMRRRGDLAFASATKDARDRGTRPLDVRKPDDPRATMSHAAQSRIVDQQLSPVFEIMIQDPKRVGATSKPHAFEGDHSRAFIYAAYGGARITAPFWLEKNPEPLETGDAHIDSTRTALIKQVNRNRRGIFGYVGRIRKTMNREKGARPLSPDEMRDLGEHLYEVLLPAEVLALYNTAQARAQGDLCVVFTSMIPWVADLPWELARAPKQDALLAARDVHFLRNVPTATPVEWIAPSDKLRMLIVSADPQDKVPLSVAVETAELGRALRGLAKVQPLEIDELHNATITTFHSAIAAGDYDVVHFIGHGYLDTETGDSGLVLEDDDGLSDKLGGADLRAVLAGRGIRLIFLNACDTGSSRRDINDGGTAVGGVAQDLFMRGVPNVLANQFPVGDHAAIAFAAAFYDFLSRGMTVAQSVREARIAIGFARNSKVFDGAVPVLYASDPEDRLVTKT
jgi:hypothetical protein